MYLQDPGPTVFFVSYFYQFADSRRAPQERTQTARAAALVSAAMTFRRQIYKGTLPPARMGKNKIPLCSTPYKYM